MNSANEAASKTDFSPKQVLIEIQIIMQIFSTNFLQK